MNQFGPLKDQADPLVATNTLHHGGSYLSRIVLPVEETEGGQRQRGREAAD
jgi:hypothetical protein